MHFGLSAVTTRTAAIAAPLRSLRVKFATTPVLGTAAAFAVYAASYRLLESAFGPTAGAAVTAPVLLAAWYRGIRGGLFASIFGIALNLTLDGSFTPAEMLNWLVDEGGWLGGGALIVVSVAVGKLRSVEHDRASAEIHLCGLSWRLAEFREEQNRYIARELHDEIGQQLTGLKLQLEIADESALASARAITTELMHRVRTLSLELRPAVLDDLGLIPALRQQLTHFTERTNIQVQFRSEGMGERVDPDVEIAAYRIVQEALTNVARYAGVEEVFVDATIEHDELVVLIEDYGRGMKLPRGRDRRLAGSTGITGMQERARSVGGRARVHSELGEGTRVEARLPARLPPDLDPNNQRDPG